MRVALVELAAGDPAVDRVADVDGGLGGPDIGDLLFGEPLGDVRLSWKYTAAASMLLAMFSSSRRVKWKMASRADQPGSSCTAATVRSAASR